MLTANDLTDLKVPPSQEHDILWKMIKGDKPLPPYAKQSDE